MSVDAAACSCLRCLGLALKPHLCQASSISTKVGSRVAQSPPETESSLAVASTARTTDGLHYEQPLQQAVLTRLLSHHCRKLLSNSAECCAQAAQPTLLQASMLLLTTIVLYVWHANPARSARIDPHTPQYSNCIASHGKEASYSSRRTGEQARTLLDCDCKDLSTPWCCSSRGPVLCFQPWPQ